MYLVVKNLRGKLEDISTTVPEKNIDYTLLVDVSLDEIRMKQVETDDEDENRTFILKPSGSMRLIKKDYEFRSENNIPELQLEDGHIVEYEAQLDSAVVSESGTNTGE